MAESRYSGQDELTYSICVDVFYEPVSLPCSHSFCRSCLQLFLEQFQKDSASGSADPKVRITCPVCRSPVTLGTNSVQGLPANVDLAQKVKKLEPETTAAQCSMCEGDKSEAVKVCISCTGTLLYCEECLSAFHPMRGPLKGHTLISVGDYMYVTETAEDASLKAAQVPTCDKHQQPYCMYCASCHLVICQACFDKHDEHRMSRIKFAYEKLKKPILEKTKTCEEGKNKLKKCETNLEVLKKDIQARENLHIVEVEKAFQKATAELECWRKTSIEAVIKRHRKWIADCDSTLKYISMKREEIEAILDSSRQLLRDCEVFLIQGSGRLTRRMDERIPTIRGTVKLHETMKQKIAEILRLDPVTPRHLCLKETTNKKSISGPELKFSRLSDTGRMVTTNNGSVLEVQTGWFADWYHAWTDQKFQRGRMYWELEAIVTRSEALASSPCRVGVALEGCRLTDQPGKTSWGIQVEYDNGKFRYYPLRDKDKFKPEFKDWLPHSGAHRLGFCLDCVEHVLTILDCSQNQVVTSVRTIPASRPLTPALSFYDSRSMSARLISPQFSSLPDALQVVLNNL